MNKSKPNHIVIKPELYQINNQVYSGQALYVNAELKQEATQIVLNDIIQYCPIGSIEIKES